MERRIGKAGAVKRREARQREWDRQYGESGWEVGYVLNGHFDQHPRDLTELIQTAKVLRNPHTEATTAVDLQVPAILESLQRRRLVLQGTEIVDIGSWNGESSHALSIRLSPLQIRCAIEPKLTLEQLWQERKCLAIWDDD